MRASKAMQEYSILKILLFYSTMKQKVLMEKGVESVTAYNNKTQEETVIHPSGFLWL